MAFPNPQLASDPSRFDVIPYTDLSPEGTWAVLGRGSFGRVFKGSYLGLEVAIKEVLSSKEYDVEKYFRRECTIMKECRHPNIVQFIGLCLAPHAPPDYSNEPAGEDHGTAIVHGQKAVQAPLEVRKRVLIISEFLPNGNLRSRIANHDYDFPWRLRISFCIDIARALAYLHARKCMHRDLKGENLLITENDRIKICDFGFARIAARNDDEMRRISYCGTDGYMSPEILVGEEFGIKTDIFSLGVIFCEIGARKLVDDDTFTRVMPTFGMDTDEIRRLVDAKCPSAFTELAIACVALNPAQRPDMRIVLERLMAIEADIIVDSGAGAYNVGSITFKAKYASCKPAGSKLQRPQPGRIPSFQGQVQGPQYSNKATAGSEEMDSDEDIEEALAKLEKVQIGGKGSIYLNAKATEATSRLHDLQEKERPSNYAVIKGSKIGDRPGSLLQDAVLPSSDLTIKGHVRGAIAPDPREAPSWFQAPVEAVNQVHPATRAVEPPNDGRSPTPELHSEPASASASSDDLAGTPDDDVLVGGQAVMPGSLPEAQYKTIKFLSTPVPVNAIIENSNLLASTNGKRADAGPHRFTLIKPGWRALWESPMPANRSRASKRLSQSSGSNSKRNSQGWAQAEHDEAARQLTSDAKIAPAPFAGGLAALIPVHLLGAGLLARCELCDKRLGLLKPYLACDDCQDVFHVKCGDIVAAECKGLQAYSTPGPVRETAEVQNKGASKKERSKHAKKSSRKLSKLAT